MSKKLFYILSFLGLSVLTQAQEDIYLKLVAVLKEKYPDIELTNKILAVNFWSASDQESRNANQSFEKAYKTYVYAKLKGGNKGMVALAINTIENMSEAQIIFKRDGLIKTLMLNKEELKNFEILNGNFVYDSSGTEIYKDLQAESIFLSINKLITR